MLMRRLTPTRCVSAMIAAGALALAVASASGTGQAAVPGPVPKTPNVPTDIAQSFALLRTEPANGMPADVADAVASPSRFGRNSALARTIATTNGAGWVVPGADHVCVVVPDPVDGYGTVCTPNTWAKENGVVLEMRQSLSSGDASVTVLAPDGVQVVLTHAGVTQPVPTDHGVVSRVVPPGDSIGLQHP